MISCDSKIDMTYDALNSITVCWLLAALEPTQWLTFFVLLLQIRRCTIEDKVFYSYWKLNKVFKMFKIFFYTSIWGWPPPGGRYNPGIIAWFTSTTSAHASYSGNNEDCISPLLFQLIQNFFSHVYIVYMCTLFTCQRHFFKILFYFL